MHPSLVILQELVHEGSLRESHPFMQEINVFAKMFGRLSEDPVRGFNITQERTQGLLYMQDRMRRAKSGRASLNIYCGAHNVSSGKRYFSDSSSLMPPIHHVNHCSLAPSSWAKKEVCPALVDGVLIQFVEVLQEILPSISSVKLENHSSTLVYTCLTFDGKGINPGAEIYDGIIHGIIPSLDESAVQDLCQPGKNILQSMIQNFQEQNWKWINQMEVYFLQLLDLQIAVPIATYGLASSGDSDMIADRVQEILLYVNACERCLKTACETKVAPNCQSICAACFNGKKICNHHKEMHDTWVTDNRPCDNCAEIGVQCVRFKVLVTISDMAPNQEKYGKVVSGSLKDMMSGERDGPFHIHDIGHMVKNAECSLERGTHFDGQYSYDANDLVVLLSSVNEEQYRKLDAVVSHKSVLQFDKQSDEQAQQRLSNNVVDVMEEVQVLVKTDIPEQRRPWFADHHDEINKPLFLTISKWGLVFATDDHRRGIFWYRQSGLPRKVTFLPKKVKKVADIHTDDPLSGCEVGDHILSWNAVAGITFFRDDHCVVVADMGYRSLRILRGSKMDTKAKKLKPQSIKALRTRPNTTIVSNILSHNSPGLVPCGLAESNDKLLIVTDPQRKVVEMFTVDKEYLNALSVKIISSDLFQKPFDCCALNSGLMAITDAGRKSAFIVSSDNSNVLHTVEKANMEPTGVCVMNGMLHISDHANHCIYTYDVSSESLEVILGTPGCNGFQDGPVVQATITSPVGLAARGSTLYVAERPDNHQGAIRVLSKLQGAINFKKIWGNIGKCFGQLSRREKLHLERDDQEVPHSCNIQNAGTKLSPHTNALVELTEKVKNLFPDSETLDITNGFMFSQTAEAAFNTLLNFIKYTEDYFNHICAPNLLPRILLKCLTTKLAECFFGYVIQGVQGNNATIMEMRRRVTNDAFVYLLPYVNSEDSGISIRPEKARAETYSYNEHDLELDSEALLWKLLSAKSQLLTIEDKSKLKKLKRAGKLKDSQFTFGRQNGPVDLMSVIESTNIRKDPDLNSKYIKVRRALGSRPMRALRDFRKRKFGTASTLLGVHKDRIDLDNSIPGSLSYVNNLVASCNHNGADVLEPINALHQGELIVFRGTDGYPFNVLQLTSSYHMNSLTPRKEIFGNFLVEVESDGDGDTVLFFADPKWEGGSQKFGQVLRDESGKLLHLGMSYRHIGDGVYYELDRTSYNEICALSINYEKSLKQPIEDNTDDEVDLENQKDSGSDSGSDSDNDTEQERVAILTQRRCRGNRLPVVLTDFL